MTEVYLTEISYASLNLPNMHAYMFILKIPVFHYIMRYPGFREIVFCISVVNSSDIPYPKGFLEYIDVPTIWVICRLMFWKHTFDFLHI